MALPAWAQMTEQLPLSSQVNGGRRFWISGRQTLRIIFVFIAISITLVVLRANHFHNPLASKKHRITEDDMLLEKSLLPTSGDSQIKLTPQGLLPPDMASTYCAAHNWEPFHAQSEHPRQVYDLVMINSELDWLEIRLNTLHTHVDYFVVLESATTFTGLKKPLMVQENWSRFAQFHDKIIYHILENPPPPTANSWAHERHQRNAMFTQVFPFLNTTQAAHDGDVILVSDLDEIPRPATLTVLRNCDFPARLTLRSEFYYYSFQWRHVGPEWAHPEATVYRGTDETILPADLRGPSYAKQDLWNAGWHCSSCFETVAEMLRKMESFSHTEYNEERFRDGERIVRLVRTGKDLWGRWSQWYKRVDNNQDIPTYLKQDGMRERFGYMLDRDGANAGFVDYTPPAGAS
jgi:beta-1,4-mannosyl-glycoprotein beta-1,4-N-acetylglucosaminyltransferase